MLSEEGECNSEMTERADALIVAKQVSGLAVLFAIIQASGPRTMLARLAEPASRIQKDRHHTMRNERRDALAIAVGAPEHIIGDFTHRKKIRPVPVHHSQPV